MQKSLRFLFYVKRGKVHVDCKILSRDHKLSLTIQGAVLDPSVPHTIFPDYCLENLRSPSSFLPTGFYTEEKIKIPHPQRKNTHIDATLAGPVAIYIVGQLNPCFENALFVNSKDWEKLGKGYQDSTESNGPDTNVDIRIGRDCIEHSSFISELRPGGLLSKKPIGELRKLGMVANRPAESPWVARPWTRMKYFDIEELQRGPALTEYVGPNPRDSLKWRFSQHCKYFRVGIWREMTRKKEMHSGHHNFSSWQKSYQQSVPEVRAWAPGP